MPAFSVNYIIIFLLLSLVFGSGGVILSTNYHYGGGAFRPVFSGVS